MTESLTDKAALDHAEECRQKAWREEGVDLSTESIIGYYEAARKHPTPDGSLNQIMLCQGCGQEIRDRKSYEAWVRSEQEKRTPESVPLFAYPKPVPMPMVYSGEDRVGLVKRIEAAIKAHPAHDDLEWEVRDFAEHIAAAVTASEDRDTIGSTQQHIEPIPSEMSDAPATSGFMQVDPLPERPTLQITTPEQPVEPTDCDHLIEAMQAAIKRERELVADDEAAGEEVTQDSKDWGHASAAFNVIERYLPPHLQASPPEKLVQSGRGHGEPCYYCGDPCNAGAGNPGQWPIILAHKDEPGVPKAHHAACLEKRLEPAPMSEEEFIQWAGLFIAANFPGHGFKNHDVAASGLYHALKRMRYLALQERESINREMLDALRSTNEELKLWFNDYGPDEDTFDVLARNKELLARADEQGRRG